MWPFSKKYEPLKLVPADECSWNVIQGKYNGDPIIVRKNVAIACLKGHPDLSLKIGFALPLRSQKKGGLPDPEENREMMEIEDIIEREVLKDFTAVFAVVITTGTFKEVVFYASPGPDPSNTHKRIQGLIKSHEVQCDASIDKRWSAYAMF